MNAKFRIGLTSQRPFATRRRLGAPCSVKGAAVRPTNSRGAVRSSPQWSLSGMLRRRVRKSGAC
eukprot:3219514-Alexandrium_andersonii.AAC.1